MSMEHEIRIDLDPSDYYAICRGELLAFARAVEAHDDWRIRVETDPDDSPQHLVAIRTGGEHEQC